MDKKTKKSLAYSNLTDTVFYIDGKGVKQELPKGNFIQIMLLWMNEGELPKVGDGSRRVLKAGDKVHWEITCKRVSK